jgi:hypothetical protein
VKPELGTGPFDVGGLNVQFTVSTSSPGSNVPFSFESWNSVNMADVNAMSVMFSIQFGLGQSGAPGIEVTGGFVVVVMVTLPFLMSPAGTAVDPVTWTGAGLWPGGRCSSVPGLTQSPVGLAVAARFCSVSKLPKARVAHRARQREDIVGERYGVATFEVRVLRQRLLGEQARDRDGRDDDQYGPSHGSHAALPVSTALSRPSSGQTQSGGARHHWRLRRRGSGGQAGPAARAMPRSDWASSPPRDDDLTQLELI